MYRTSCPEKENLGTSCQRVGGARTREEHSRDHEERYFSSALGRSGKNLAGRDDMYREVTEASAPNDAVDRVSPSHCVNALLWL